MNVCKDSGRYRVVFLYTYSCFPNVFNGETAACTLIVSDLSFVTQTVVQRPFSFLYNSPVSLFLFLTTIKNK